MPAEVRGMLRSRPNTIEGGTSEVNRKPWRDLPRS